MQWCYWLQCLIYILDSKPTNNVRSKEHEDYNSQQEFCASDERFCCIFYVAEEALDDCVKTGFKKFYKKNFSSHKIVVDPM